MSDHLVSFALWTAFPPFPAGRDSGDYYETSVAIGLASRRRSRVRPCRTCRAERRWPTHLLQYPHWVSLRAPEVASANPEYRHRARHRFRRLSGGWRLASSGDWASGNSAFTIFRGSRGTPHPYAWARLPLSWHALVPFTFRIQVSHQTQEPPSEFLPAAPGIQQGASRRSGSAADGAKPWSGEIAGVEVAGDQQPPRPAVLIRRELPALVDAGVSLAGRSC
jgi:hypothetical protein